jgi:hypothetical protein
MLRIGFTGYSNVALETQNDIHYTGLGAYSKQHWLFRIYAV